MEWDFTQPVPRRAPRMNLSSFFYNDNDNNNDNDNEIALFRYK